jgi:hypothetical protein
VGLNARPVAQMARELGVAWHTVMNAVREYGQALVDDPERVGQVRKLGVDETTWLTATREHPDPLRHEHGRSRATHCDRRRGGQWRQ